MSFELWTLLVTYISLIVVSVYIFLQLVQSFKWFKVGNIVNHHKTLWKESRLTIDWLFNDTPARKTDRLRLTREREMFYLTTHSTHFIYGYIASDIWLRTILIVRKETCCRHIGYSYRLTARVLLYAPSHRQDNIPRPLLHQSWSTGWNEK